MKMAINCHGKVFWGDMDDYFYLIKHVRSEKELQDVIDFGKIPLATKEQIEWFAYKQGWKGNGA